MDFFKYRLFIEYLIEVLGYKEVSKMLLSEVIEEYEKFIYYKGMVINR